MKVFSFLSQTEEVFQLLSLFIEFGRASRIFSFNEYNQFFLSHAENTLCN